MTFTRETRVRGRLTQAVNAVFPRDAGQVHALLDEAADREPAP